MGEAIGVARRMEGEETVIYEKNESFSSDEVGWERFLPRMVFRVLLVEADDSTRQIIAALLRKCSYRVTAVADGLKAWETLKGRSHDIDLILTEVELPSISGYTLLTLVMEHDICKNIPIIMMSSQDSINVVLKCMLKGAADFLIKPIRRNELRNLWHHVWRRQTQTIVHVPENTAVEQQKVDVTSENTAASNNSSDYLDSTPKHKECSGKGSNGQGLLQLKCGSTSNLSNTEKHEEYMKLVEKSVVPKGEIGGKSIGYESESVSCNGTYKLTAFSFGKDHGCAKDADSGLESQSGHANHHIDNICEPSSEALDLIGKFEHRRKDTYGTLSANGCRNNLSFAPELELSLGRFYPANEVTDKRHILNPSNASVCSWYNNSKASQSLSLDTNCTELKEGSTIFHYDFSSYLPENTVGTQSLGDASSSQENMSTLLVGQSGHAEADFPGPQLGFIPVNGVKFDSFCAAGSGQIYPLNFYTQYGFTPPWSPKGQQEQSPFLVSSPLHSSSEIHYSDQGNIPYEETTNHSANQTVQGEDKDLESLDLLRHGSPNRGLSGIGSLCSGIESKLNSSSETMCNRSDGDATPAAAAVRTSVSKRVNYNCFFIHDGLRGMDSHCSSQREAALIKFRLKRKDRCYEKKVRYQSRKRLAEQRPRVKGQFVCQLQTEAPPPES